jgi:release factor glutamine methyltransferase
LFGNDSVAKLSPVTVLEVIQRSTQFLAQKGVDSPRLQVELLLAHLLRLPRLQLYLNFQRELDETELSRLREFVKRRGQREPLQHIVGTTSFVGLEIKCSRAALIPRPETEQLAERGWKYLQSLEGGSPAVLDVGTGSGCIAIAIASKVPAARVTALDISPDALALAHTNAAALSVSERIDFIQGDALTFSASRAFDLVVSNPPYIPSAEITELEPEVKEFDPMLALDGGPDGLSLFRRLAAESGKWLKPGGIFMAEFSDGQEVSLRTLFESENWIVEDIAADYSGRPRILTARLKPSSQQPD